MIEFKLTRPITIADASVSVIVIDEAKVTAKVIREARRESAALKHSVDESVDNLICKVCGMATFELDSLDGRDYLRLIREVDSFLSQ